MKRAGEEITFPRILAHIGVGGNELAEKMCHKEKGK